MQWRRTISTDVAASTGSNPHTFASQVLRNGAGAYSALAAERLIATFTAPRRTSSEGFRGWRNDLNQRLVQLAAAVEVGEPGLFEADMVWVRAAFDARGLPPDELLAGLKALRETLQEELPPEAWTTVAPYVERAESSAADRASPVRHLDGSGPHGELALKYLQAVLVGRRTEGLELLSWAMDAGTTIEEIYEQVLMSAQAEIGTMWHLAEISIAEEHAATEATRHAMSVLSQRAPRAAPNGVTVVVGAAEGDRHDIGVRAAADLLDFAGFDTIYLGADVPRAEFRRACVMHGASLIVLGVSMGVHLTVVEPTISELRAIGAGEGESGLAPPGIIVGGAAFAGMPDLPQRLGADVYAPRLPSVPRLAKRMLDLPAA